jgi:hypothetical protein
MSTGRPRLFLLAVLMVLLVPLSAIADGPTTQPTTTQPDFDSIIIVRGFGDGDPSEVAEAADLRQRLHSDADQARRLRELDDRLQFQYAQFRVSERTAPPALQQQRIQYLNFQATIAQNLMNRLRVQIPADLRAAEEFLRRPSTYSYIESTHHHHRGRSTTRPANHASQPAVPQGCMKSPLFGNPNGQPFTAVQTAGDIVIGFKYSLVDGQGPEDRVIHDLRPMYPAADGGFSVGNNIVLANDGYVVGGLVVDADQSVNGFQIIFMRLRGGKIDSSDTYTSEWCGTPAGNHQQTLTGNGRPVIGIYGQQGTNLNAVGLVRTGGNP